MTLGGSASAGDGNENAAKENCRTSQTRTPSPHPDRFATEPLRLDPPGSAIQTDLLNSNKIMKMLRVRVIDHDG